MATRPTYTISCHCGIAALAITRPPAPPDGSGPRPLNLCHCANCRHNSGLLCASNMAIDEPPSTEGLATFQATPCFRRYFCAQCGCHVFWRGEDPESGHVAWAVATGVIEARVDDETAGGGPEQQYGRHINVAGLKDGGLKQYMPEIAGYELEEFAHWGGDDDEPADSSSGATAKSTSEQLPGFCYCRNVSFHITRPDASSALPKSGYPDLTVPFYTGDPRIKNPDDEKWWLRESLEGDGKQTRYLAGTCACRSCRLVSGWEIQTWAFVPRSNIFFHVPGSAAERAAAAAEQIVPLDFGILPHGILKSYESSSGVQREFCAKCGATVFWHDKWRPELIDVSVGLLDAEEGALARTWLDWCMTRTSFAEEAGNGRRGVVAERAVQLIASLEKGLRAAKDQEQTT